MSLSDDEGFLNDLCRLATGDAGDDVDGEGVKEEPKSLKSEHDDAGDEVHGLVEPRVGSDYEDEKSAAATTLGDERGADMDIR
jgi:hypothetical protein